MKNKRDWKQWKEDVKSMPIFQNELGPVILFFILFFIFVVLLFMCNDFHTPAPWWIG
ncbi:hypothetical protein FACS189427_02780 [Planctomycetales bacterium]|nr:hypothetical protein FACS189427_02780 [Planctomycetales bacterium]